MKISEYEGGVARVFLIVFVIAGTAAGAIAGLRGDTIEAALWVGLLISAHGDEGQRRITKEHRRIIEILLGRIR